MIHNVLREFGEELFDIEELERDRGYVAFEWFYEAPPVKELRDLLATGEAQLLLTGVAVNLLNLRPEVCTLLLILTPEWYRVHSKDIKSRGLLCDNWEFADAAELARTRQVGLAPPPVFGPYGDLLSYWNVAPPGAAAYYLGLGVAADTLAAKGIT